MIFRFILVSDEVDDFRRDITIDSDATFLDLYNAILDSTGYHKDQITSFFICDDDWTKQTEITLIDMDSGADKDNYVMDRCRLSELIDEEGQKLVYIFEPLTERCFFMELREITIGKSQDRPKIVKSVGQPPQQTSAIEEFDFAAPTTTTTHHFDDEEDFYDGFGDDQYNEEDLDNFTEGNPFEY
jgi:hypothetical protein